MIRRYYLQKRAGRVAASGLGAFSPRALKALVDGSCATCGRPISDFALFGNALVVNPGAATFACAACRQLPQSHPHSTVLRGIVDRSEVVVSMADYRAQLNLKDIELVLALRTSYARLQDRRTHAIAFNLKTAHSFEDHLYANDPLYAIEYVEPVQKRYGNLLAIGNCGECGAWWPHSRKQLAEHRSGRKSFADGTAWSDTACWSCGCPHEAQWHMRTTLDHEVGMLAEWQHLRPDA